MTEEEFRKLVDALILRYTTKSEIDKYVNYAKKHNLTFDFVINVIKFCHQRKGRSVRSQYIMAVLEDFVSKNITEIKIVENKPIKNKSNKLDSFSDALYEKAKRMGIL